MHSASRVIVLIPWLMGLVAYAAEPPITALAFVPDGSALVSCSQSGVHVHNWPDLQVVRSLQTSLVNVHDLAFSPDAQRLAVAGGTPAESGGVEVLSWPDGEALFVCGDHEDSVLAVSWLDDSRLAMASLDHAVTVWNTGFGQNANPAEVRRFIGHSRGVSALCNLPRQQLMISGGLDQNLRVWNIEIGEMLRTLNNHTREVHQVVVRPAQEGLPMVASISNDSTVRLWQPTIGRMVRFARLDSIPMALAWLPDGTRLVVSCADGHVRVIDPDTIRVIDDMPAFDSWAYALAVHPSDSSLAVGGRRGVIKRIVLR